MSKHKLLIISGVVGVLLLGIFSKVLYFHPTKIPAPAKYKGVTITLERTACYGICPVYKLTIYGDGKVNYTGEKYVTTTGTETTHIPAQEVVRLVDKFYEVKYFTLQNKYTASVTDLPTTITSITIDGKTKQIEDYYGAPKELRELENIIDQTVRSSQWVGR